MGVVRILVVPILVTVYSRGMEIGFGLVAIGGRITHVQTVRRRWLGEWGRTWRILCLQSGRRCGYYPRVDTRTNVHGAPRGDRHKPRRDADGIWRRRSSAAPAVTLESKLCALREATAEGSRERLRAEAEFIVEARPFLRSVCRWYRGPDLADEDLEAEAELALVEAMREWKPGGRPFDTFARWGVRFALAKLLRSSRMIRGRGREGRMCGTSSMLHGLESGRRGPASLGGHLGHGKAELQNALSDTRGVEARMLDVAQMVERASDVAALTEAVMELGAEDRAVVTAWLADSRGRALPLRLRERLREMVG